VKTHFWPIAAFCLFLLFALTAQAVFIPANGANNVNRSANIVVQFGATMNTNSFSTNKFIYHSRLNGFRHGAVSATSTL
jgi:hypothetical protein